jgi:hypothetical protein
MGEVFVAARQMVEVTYKPHTVGKEGICVKQWRGVREEAGRADRSPVLRSSPRRRQTRIKQFYIAGY